MEKIIFLVVTKGKKMKLQRKNIILKWFFTKPQKLKSNTWKKNIVVIDFHIIKKSNYAKIHGKN